jgi:hypothetical protein
MVPAEFDYNTKLDFARGHSFAVQQYADLAISIAHSCLSDLADSIRSCPIRFGRRLTFYLVQE